MKRWKQRPEGSTWGDYGADDQLGRANLLTSEKVRQGVAEVREGLAFCLSLPLDYPGKSVVNPRRHPPVLRPTLRNGRINYLYRFDQDTPGHHGIVCDDAAIIHLQYSSQWDSLAHVGALFDADGDGEPEARFYNGWRGGVDIVGPVDLADAGATGNVPAKSTSFAHKLSVANMAEKCMQGRGVMIDLHAHFGRDRKVVGYDDLMRVMNEDGVVVEPGDMVCLYTGFAQLLLEMDKNPDVDVLNRSCAALDGGDERLKRWITESQLVSLISDNYAVEAVPPKPGTHALQLHDHCLFRIGVNLGEMWELGPLAQWLRAHRRYRFLLTAPPLRLPGAVGSPPAAVATV